MTPEQSIQLFDGSGTYFPAVITSVEKKKVTVTIQSREAANCESPLDLHLGQVISRGDKMEFTIQKAVSLGSTPLLR